jgi:general secretion pathway protein D
MYKKFLIATAAALLAACSQMRPAPLPVNVAGHLDGSDVGTQAGIPEVVQHTPFIPPPQPVPESERYTVVVNDVPVRELLFALARDAAVNVDIHPSIEGSVTLNAIDQTLTQILDRIANQVDLRYVINGDTVLISADEPYFRTYDVGYVNLSRDVETNVNVAVQVATTGEGAADTDTGGGRGGGSTSGDNTSQTRLKSTSYNRFWETLNANILAIIGDVGENRSSGLSDNVVVNAEAGLINVKATARDHELVQGFIDRVLRNSRRQVMIEATIVEVTLNDQYQAGVDWRVLLNEGESGFVASSGTLGSITDGVIDSAISSFIFGYRDPDKNGQAIDVTVRLLREFGDTKVLSSPRMMALNNQTAMLKVVEELIYFDIEVENRDGTNQSAARTFVDTDAKSVPVGIVMAVTPQISDNSEITLTIRPSISEKIGDAVDPGPQINGSTSESGESVTNLVPIIRVREMESVLRLNNGQIAVLGGLMQDNIQAADRSVPGLSKIPFFGEMFFDTQENSNKKTELVIFLRPVVVNDPSLETDLKGYQQFLSNNVKNPVY